MGEIDKKGKYTTIIPYDDYPTVEGRIVLVSDNKHLNSYLEKNIRRLLRDIYYGHVEDFDLYEY